MVHDVSRPHATPALRDDEPDAVGAASCPACHTGTTVTQSALDAGAAWRCVRCGQQWNAVRLTAVTAYAAWVADRERTGSTR